MTRLTEGEDRIRDPYNPNSEVRILTMKGAKLGMRLEVVCTMCNTSYYLGWIHQCRHMTDEEKFRILVKSIAMKHKET